MKVLLLNQTFLPDRVSTAQQVLDIALFLREEGCDVTVVTDRRGYEQRSLRFPARESYRGIEIHRVPSTGLGKRTAWRRIVDSMSFNFMALLKMVRLPAHDIVVSFTSPPLVGFLGTLYGCLRGARSVQWLMDINPDAAMEVGYLRKGSLLARTLTAIFRFTLRRSFRIVVLDRWMKSRIASHGAEEKNIVVIPPWTLQEPPRSEIPKAENPFAKAHGLQEKFVILYSGNFSIAHPFQTMLDAADRLKGDPSIHFLFVGDGIRAKDIDRAIESHGLGNVTKLPWQPRETLPFSLSSGDLHVVVMGETMSGLAHTSKIYGILSAGKPYVFIGPQASHLGDLLAECPHGYHVEHGDVDGFVAIIERVRRLTFQERAAIASANRDYVSAYHTPKKCLAPLRDVIFC